MKSQQRALRITAALTLAGLIASQIPMRGQTALGSENPPTSAIQPSDGYLSGSVDNSGNFLGIKGITNRNTISGIALGLIGLGTYSTIADRHAKKTVVLPSKIPNANNKPIYDVLKSMPADFSEIVKLVEIGEQVNFLREDNPYTFFAPTNAGLISLGTARLNQLQDPAHKAALVELIKHHTLAGRYKVSELLALKEGTALETLSGEKVIIGNKNGILTLNNIPIVQNDIAASNGWIHPLEAPLDSD